MTYETKPHRMAARLFGVFFILTFLSYGIGSGLVATIADGPDGLAGIYANKATFMIGIILIAVVHSFVNIGLSVLMYPVLKPFNRFLALGYFGAGVTASVTAVIGAIFLALLVPLSGAFVEAGTDATYFDTLALLLKQGGFYGYQMSMTLWGLGGLMLCYVLFVSRLVPRVFAMWGALGYVIFMTGTTAEMFGYPVGTMLSLPGGLFELGLSLWLIIKGFNLPRPIASADAILGNTVSA
tara:strand:+ start:70 stop:786 length:717 start_codon:yes stop_codon:yes gene_type:complete